MTLNKTALSGRMLDLEALSSLSTDRLSGIVKEITGGWEVRPVALPLTGLGILKMEDGAFNEPFYLGEFPVASAHISVTTSNGEEVEGAAVIMSDDGKKAETLALCDAILTNKLEGFEKIQCLVSDGKIIRENEAMERSAMMERSRVDFSLLDEAGGQNEY